MLSVVCVQVQNYCGHGRDYVNRLYAGVDRWLTLDKRFVCYTDDWEGLRPEIERRHVPGGVEGWHNKLFLFKEGEFADGERVLFLDLDTLVVGPLDDIGLYAGRFAILRDFYRQDGFGSGVMAWAGGFGSHIWSEYERQGRPIVPGGDQAWIEQHVAHADRLQDLYPNQMVSFREHCQQGCAPGSARLVCFHGEPKPHNSQHQWVRDEWCRG